MAHTMDENAPPLNIQPSPLKDVPLKDVPLKADAPAVTACRNFKLDLAAAGFGCCKNCGLTQAQHKDLRAKANWKKTAGPDAAAAKMVKAAKPCKAFRVDVFAAEFGSCKRCGHLQAHHTAHATGKLKGQTAKRATAIGQTSSRPARPLLMSGLPLSEKACGNYQVDVLHATFGTCRHCGHTQAGHKLKGVNADYHEAQAQAAQAALAAEQEEKAAAERRAAEQERLAQELDLEPLALPPAAPSRQRRAAAAESEAACRCTVM